MSDVLDKICADKRRHVAERKAAVPAGEIEERAASAPPPRGFAAALAQTQADGRYALIAEIKKASPSGGLICEDFDPPALAHAYAEGGATCLSVLTDAPYFQGADEFLTSARTACALPVLRKDFMLDPYQIAESRALGADCVLLILAALDDATAGALAADARRLGMDVLMEVHDDDEMGRALALGPTLLGINNRNLKTLAVDLGTTERLAAMARDAGSEALLVSESGIHGPRDLARMAEAGVGAFLVGESLMRQADVTAATRALLGDAPAVARA